MKPLTEKLQIPPGFQNMQAFTLLEALMGRRSRRFFRGAQIADGVFAYKSRQAIEPLSELEKLQTKLTVSLSSPCNDPGSSAGRS